MLFSYLYALFTWPLKMIYNWTRLSRKKIPNAAKSD